MYFLAIFATFIFAWIIQKLFHCLNTELYMYCTFQKFTHYRQCSPTKCIRSILIPLYNHPPCGRMLFKLFLVTVRISSNYLINTMNTLYTDFKKICICTTNGHFNSFSNPNIIAYRFAYITMRLTQWHSCNICIASEMEF